jgi:hypothetical protein
MQNTGSSLAYQWARTAGQARTLTTSPAPSWLRMTLDSRPTLGGLLQVKEDSLPPDCPFATSVSMTATKYTPATTDVLCQGTDGVLFIS